MMNFRYSWGIISLAEGHNRHSKPVYVNKLAFHAKNPVVGTNNSELRLI